MNHCQHCDANVKKSAKVCWSCHVKVKRAGLKAPKLFCRFVDLFHVMFVVLTLFSMFTTQVPTFQICSAGLMVLRLVKRSADYMAELGPMRAYEVVLTRNGAAHRNQPSRRKWQSAFEKSRKAAA